MYNDFGPQRIASWRKSAKSNVLIEQLRATAHGLITITPGSRDEGLAEFLESGGLQAILQSARLQLNRYLKSRGASLFTIHRKGDFLLRVHDPLALNSDITASNIESSVTRWLQSFAEDIKNVVYTIAEEEFGQGITPGAVSITIGDVSYVAQVVDIENRFQPRIRA